MSSSLESPPTTGWREPELTPKLSEKWMLGLEHVMVVLAAAALFLIAGRFPLRPTDLWGHVLYGEWILQHRALPQQDPFAPLAEGMPVADSAWGSQVILAGVLRAVGPAGLAVFYDVLLLVTYGLLMCAFYRQAPGLRSAPRLTLALFGSASALLIAWSRISTIRPESFGTLCFAAMLYLIARQETAADETDPTSRSAARFLGLRPEMWLGIPLLVLIWANLHGSFACGLVLLGCLILGHYFEAVWKHGGLLRAFAAPEVRGYLVLLELAGMASCVNPLGPDLVVKTIFFASNANLRELLEWQTLSILGVGGRQFAFSWVLMIFALRWSRAPLRGYQVLSVAAFAAAAVGGIRMLGWYGPVVMFALMPHLAATVLRWQKRYDAASAADPDTEPLFDFSHSFRYNTICAALILCIFFLSDVSTSLVGYKPRKEVELFGVESPIALSRFLDQHREYCDGLVFVPQNWGDWLVWTLAQPSGRKMIGLDDAPLDFKPFMTSNVHLAPRQVWVDYSRISSAAAGPDRVYNRYAINTVILDASLQSGAVRILRESPDWVRVFDDPQAAVFRRKDKMPAAPTTSPPPEGAPPAKAEPANSTPPKAEATGSAPAKSTIGESVPSKASDPAARPGDKPKASP